MDSFLKSLAGLGPLRLVAVLGITIGLTIALVLMSANMGKADKALLYSQLSLKDAGAISARLDQMNIAYEFRSGGTAVFIERDKIESAKMALAAESLPSSGSIGYDIFDSVGSMGQTTFTQNINKLRALQGELERTITSMDGVDAARVLLVLPERKLFQTKAEKAKASVTIKLGINAIGSAQTNAIRHLVAASVPGLTTMGVTVIDDAGKVLAGGEDANGEGGINSVDRRLSIENALRRKIKKVLTPVVGLGGVEVEVSAELDMKRITEHASTIDPDSQVVISSDTSTQNSDEKDRGQGGAVTVSENVPGGSASRQGAAGSYSLSTSETETINYAVSKTDITTIYQSGNIVRLSVAVNVDGSNATDADGNAIWSARSPEEMAKIEALVKSAIGFDAARKDRVQVTNLRFLTPTPLTADPNAKGPGFGKNDIMRLIELGILAIVSIVMILFLGRPLLQTLLSGSPPVIGGMGTPAMALVGGGGGVMPQLPGASVGGDGQMALPAPDMGAEYGDVGLDVSQIEGQVKASSVKKVASIVESHPEESVSILRAWLHEA